MDAYGGHMYVYGDCMGTVLGLVTITIQSKHSFYEGKGTKYRAEPKDILAVFDYLKNR